jgi:hypothetical protein
MDEVYIEIKKNNGKINGGQIFFTLLVTFLITAVEEGAIGTDALL